MAFISSHKQDVSDLCDSVSERGSSQGWKIVWRVKQFEDLKVSVSHFQILNSRKLFLKSEFFINYFCERKKCSSNVEYLQLMSFKLRLIAWKKLLELKQWRDFFWEIHVTNHITCNLLDFLIKRNGHLSLLLIHLPYYKRFEAFYSVFCCWESAWNVRVI